MSALIETVTSVRRILRLDEDVQELKARADTAEDRLIDLDRRMIRLETVVQYATGSQLPPLSPRLP
jgi:hypothetical protein